MLYAGVFYAEHSRTINASILNGLQIAGTEIYLFSKRHLAVIIPFFICISKFAEAIQYILLKISLNFHVFAFMVLDVSLFSCRGKPEMCVTLHSVVIAVNLKKGFFFLQYWGLKSGPTP
jgi:hypothetical protein